MSELVKIQNGKELCHFGIPGMHWGVRRSPEELGHPTRPRRKPSHRDRAFNRSVIGATISLASALAIGYIGGPAAPAAAVVRRGAAIASGILWGNAFRIASMTPDEVKAKYPPYDPYD